MPHRIELTGAARRDLAGLLKNVLVRVDSRILALAEEPRPRGATKLKGQENLYRIRVGDYRVVYEIDDAERVIVVARVRHRREVYRGR